MAEDKIRYSDIIQPDDSIEKLIGQLDKLNSAYETTVNAIRAGADRIVHALKTTSGATQEGREAIEDAASTATKLQKAQEQVVDSYKFMMSEVKAGVALWRSLSAEEREQIDLGEELREQILAYKKELKALDEQLKVQIPILSAVEKAEKQLIYVRSEEYTQLLKLKEEIAATVKTKKAELNSDKDLVAAKGKLEKAQHINTQELKSLAIQTEKANKIAELNARIANSSVGSYDNLSARYALAKLRLNEMGIAEREAGNAAEVLENELKDLYQQMSLLQKKTGKHALDVGNYGKVWSGVGFSVQQVVRELPTLTQGSLIFFRAIANNIPILIDDIQRLRLENKAAIAQGKPTTSVIKQIVSSLFSWQSAIVVGLTLLASHGDKVVEWAKDLVVGKKAATSLADQLKAIKEVLDKGSNTYGDQITKFQTLKQKYIELRTEAEKRQFIKDNKSDFDSLGLAINNVNEADLAFINQTQNIIKAIGLRARAAALLNVAAQKYTEAFQKQIEIEQAEAEEPSFMQKARDILLGLGITAKKMGVKLGTFSKLNAIADLYGDKKILEEEAGAFSTRAEEIQKKIAKLLGPLGKNEPTAKTRQAGSDRDLTDRVHKAALDVQKKYEASITELEREEYDKRKKEITDKANAEIRALQETYRKNEEYLNDTEDRYEDLSEAEIRLVVSTQNKIQTTIKNKQEQLSYELEQIELERQAKSLQTQEEAIDLRLQAVRKGSEEEYALQVESLENQRQLALIQNRLLPANQRQSEADINAAFDSKQLDLGGQFSLNQFDQLQATAKAKFNAVEHSETEITKFTLNQEKERLQKQLDLVEAGGLKWGKEQIDAAKYAIQGIDRELAELNDPIAQIAERGLGTTLLESLGFNEKAIKAVDEFSSILIDNINAILEAEIEAAEKAVELAEERVEAAQKAYDAEVEARNNGYANNVATAKKELEQEKKNQLQKQKILEDAQRRQEQIDSITQASSLVTASAGIWASFSKLGPFGVAAALAAIATMWTSFAAAKIKAKQVTATASEEYGEGGIEFLDGGSHASGNDIDLGINNKRNKRMRAEGGEALAIINKRNTRRYKKILPDIVESLNKGVFEDKFMNAFSGSREISILQNTESIDLSKVEKEVQTIRKQNELKCYADNGRLILIKGNITKIIKN